ncbi:MAG: hypothetical protein V3S29_02755 [bacterium]
MEVEKTQQDLDEAEWQNVANWRLGLFYFSEKDSRIWVPKRRLLGRGRTGGTPNLAKPAARQYMMMLAGGFALLLVLLSLLRNAGILG